MDIHHGDGVESAFAYSRSVYTLSFHRHAPGFFPGTGAAHDTGHGSAQGSALNVPLEPGLSTVKFTQIFDRIVQGVVAQFEPEVVVLQAGVDGLAGDVKVGGGDGWNLDIDAYTHTLRSLRAHSLPMLILGGGGYNHANAARTWTKMTAEAAGVALDDEVPDHAFWPEYGPDYRLAVTPSPRVDVNDVEAIVGAALRTVNLDGH